MNILIVEDEKPVAEALVALLKEIPNTNIVDTATTFEEGFQMASSNVFDIILIDVMLSGHCRQEGLRLCHLIRRRQKDIPIIIITGHHCSEVLERAFTNGANDYIKKPFDSRELQLRVQSWLTISRKMHVREKLQYGQLVYQPSEHEFYLAHDRLILTKKIKALLLIFLRQPEELLTREYIQAKLWGDRDLTIDRNLRSNIQRLRRVFPKSLSLKIGTVWGQGYVLQEVSDD